MHVMDLSIFDIGPCPQTKVTNTTLFLTNKITKPCQEILGIISTDPNHNAVLYFDCSLGVWLRMNEGRSMKLSFQIVIFSWLRLLANLIKTVIASAFRMQ